MSNVVYSINKAIYKCNKCQYENIFSIPENEHPRYKRGKRCKCGGELVFLDLIRVE